MQLFTSFKIYLLIELLAVLKHSSRALMVLSFLILVSGSVLGEGSKELNANGGDRAYLSTSTSATVSNPFPTQGLVRVFVNAGETIYIGSSAQGVGGGTMYLRSPSGVLIPSGTSITTGLIKNRAQELIGPLPAAGGYTPFTQLANESGIWSVFFLGATSGTNPGKVSSNADWPVSSSGGIVGDRSGDVAAFDVSVSASPNAASAADFVKGRAYLNVFGGSLWDFTGQFYGVFHVLTNDGYEYKVEANGLAGNGFVFFSNNKGYKTNGSASYLSENSTSVTRLHDPRAPDIIVVNGTGSDITHKLFFNTPASDLPGSATIRSNNGSYSDAGSSGTTWLKSPSPVLPEIKEFVFKGIEGTPDAAGTTPLGGFIGFKANQAGAYTITIDVNNNGLDAADVTLRGDAKADTNLVYWNGKNALGTALPSGTVINASSVKVSLKAGEVHFPFIDVENNPGGIIITRLEDNNTTVYWNDTGISYDSGAGWGNGVDKQSDPIVQLAGVSSTVNGHKWGSTNYKSGDFGNEVGLDTWTYLLSNTIASDVSFRLRQADLSVENLTSDKAAYCLGETITYTFKIRNSGPDGVIGARAAFNFPAELKFLAATYTLAGGAVVSNQTTSDLSANAILNLPNLAEVTVLITGRIDAKPASGSLNVSASILRPADVTDPDATNADMLPPTDPQLECDGGTIGCNNVKALSVGVVVSDISISGTASVAEGSVDGATTNMTFTVSLSAPNPGCDVSVNYNIQNISSENDDFVSTLVKNGTLTFSAGETIKTILVPIVHDKIVESNESFDVVLSNASAGGKIIVAKASGTINNDDVISGVTVTKTDGSEGVKNGSFIFSFDAYESFDVATDIKFTLAGTAKGTDYTPSVTTITIPAGQNSATLNLAVNDDNLAEGLETITITLQPIVNAYGVIPLLMALPVVNIADNDYAKIAIDNPSVVEGDDGQTTFLNFNVTLSGNTGGPFTINYATVDGTAAAAEDYIAQSNSLTFSGEAGTQPVTVQVNGDKKIETDETLKVVLSGLTVANNFGGHLSFGSTSGTGTIVDDDNTDENKRITITSADGKELGPISAVFTFSFPPGVSTDQPTTINFSLGGNALNASDYTGGTVTSVTIPAGSTSAKVTFGILDDNIIEDQESILLTSGAVTNTSFNDIIVVNSPQTLSIIDDDFANVLVTAASVIEGDNGQKDLVFDVRLDKETGSSFTIGYSTADGTAIAGEDYTSRTGILTFGSEAETQQVRIPITGDLKIETDETLSLILGPPSKTFDNHLTVNGSPASGIIKDDDNIAAKKIIKVTAGNGYEKTGPNATFTFSLPTGVTSDADTRITYTLGGTALGEGSDYLGSISGTIVIEAGKGSATLTLPIVDDVTLEGPETVILTVTDISSENPAYTDFTISASSETQLYILSDDSTVLLSSPHTVIEGQDGITYIRFKVSLDLETSEPFTVNYFTTNGTATGGEDYQVSTGTVKFAGNSNEFHFIEVPIYGDLKIEDDESFLMTIDDLSEDFGGALTLSPPVKMTIEDDDNIPDNKLIGISKTNGSEDGTNGIFTLSFPPGVTADTETIISYSLTGTAEGNNIDYKDNSLGTATIPAGFNSVPVNLTVSDDLIIEGAETVILEITSISNAGYLGMGAKNSPLSLDILDNDIIDPNIIISLSKVADGKEGLSNPRFVVSFPSGITASVPTEVKYHVSGGAKNGEDYSLLTGTVIIPKQQNSAFINLSVVDDQIIEGTETVDLTLTEAVNSILTLTTAPGVATAIIEDNDNLDVNKIITLKKLSNGEEAGMDAQYEVSYPAGITSAKDTRIVYTVAGGTAVESLDYSTLTREVTIPAGAPSALINVQVLDDNIIEKTETILLRLVSADNSFAGTTVQPSVAVAASIADNDNTSGNNKITLSWEKDAKEPDQNGQFRITYPANIVSSEDTEVTYSIGGTATEDGSDYEVLTGSVIIPANANSVPIEIAVVDDKVIEATETVELALTGASNSFMPTVDPTMESVSIADDDNIGSNNRIILKWVADGSEPGSSAHFTVGFPDGYTSSAVTTVSYTVSGTAKSDEDFVALTGLVTIPASATSVPIYVSVLNDNIIEGVETVAITLTGADNPVIPGLITLPTSAVSANIEDEDDDNPANNVIALGRTHGSEPGNNARFTVSYPAGFSSSKETIVSYQVGGTASPDKDYLALSGTFTIPANANSAAVEVEVLDDKIIEPTETVGLTVTNANNSVSQLSWVPAAELLANIDDDDNNPANKTISLSKISDGSEPGMKARFKVGFPAGYTSSVETVISYSIAGTATLGDDFTIDGSDPSTRSGTVAIPANTMDAFIEVNVVDDRVIEPTETVELTLTGASSMLSGIVLKPAGTFVSASIADDDNVTENKYIYLTLVNHGVEGTSNPQLRVSFPEGVSSSEATAINYKIVPSATSATSGNDYMVLPGSVIIPANTNSALIDISLINDKILEPTETVELVLVSASNNIANGLLTQLDGVTANIVDDDNVAENNIITLTKIRNGSEPAITAQYSVGFPDDYVSSVSTRVEFTSAGGSAVDGVDYRITHEVIIPANSGSAVIDVEVLDDKIIEDTETVELALTNASNTLFPTIKVSSGAVIAEINDDDNTLANRTIVVSKTDGSEDGDDASFRFNLPTGITLGKDISIPFKLSGKATSGADYNQSVNAVITFPAGAGGVALELPVIDDEIVEDTENITITPAAINSSYGSFSIDASSVLSLNIIDNDNATLEVSGPLTVTEGANGTSDLTFTVTLNKTTTGNFDVSFATEDGTARVSDNDYISAAGSLSFSGQAGESRSITVKVRGDKKIESDEALSLSLSGLSTSFNDRLALPASPVTVTITNDDSGTLVITPADAVEGGTPGSFTIGFSDPDVSAEVPVTINFGLSGTATSADYAIPSSPATIPAGENRTTLNVAIVDDELVEGVEIVTLTPNTAGGLPYGITLANTPLAVSIADNDVATLRISNATIAEGNSGTKDLSFTVTLDKATQGPFSIGYSTADVTAKAGDDYEAALSDAVVDFDGTANESKTIKIRVKGDSRIEANETFRVRLGTLSNSFDGKLAVSIIEASATGTIENDDTGEIVITRADGVEGGANASFTFGFRNGITSDEATVISYSLGGAASGSGSEYDYTLLPASGTLTIPANAASVTLELLINDDDIMEESETVEISNVALITGGLSSYITVDVIRPTVTIVDNDHAALSVSGPVTVTEGADGAVSARFTVTLDKPTGNSFSVNYQTLDGSATAADNDYVSASGTLNFGGVAGESYPVTVLINGDQKIEADEMFSLGLNSLSNDFNDRLQLPATPALLSIMNDDSGDITIAGADGREGAYDASFTFSFPDGVSSDAPVTINYGLDGTASSADYLALTSGTITIPAGENSVNLTLNVSDDNILEPTETVKITTGAVNSTHSNIKVINSPQVLHIEDNEYAGVSISNIGVTEGHSGKTNLMFIVTLDKPVANPFTLRFNTEDGTATVADRDYDPKSGVLSFSGTAGEVRTIVVPVNGDMKIERDEMFSVILSDLSDKFNGRLKINRARAAGTIQDDDNTRANNVITLSHESDGAEPGTNAQLKVSFPNGITSTEATEVSYAIGGSAIEGEDYETSDRKIIIPANSNEAYINISVLNDRLVEETETVEITLTGATSILSTLTVEPGETISAEIKDDDVATLSVSDVTIIEGQQGTTVATFTVSLDNAVSKSFRVTYATSDGTALLSDNDYISSSGPLNFDGRAGETRTFTVLIKGDPKIEEDETFTVSLGITSLSFEGRLRAGASGTGTIVNDDLVPNAVDDAGSTDEDTPLTLSITANDTDADGVDPSTIQIKTNPAKGIVTVNADGTVRYTPRANYVGIDEFTYTVRDIYGLESNVATVTITVRPVNDAPVAVDDNACTCNNELVVKGNVLSNDTDIDGDRLIARLASAPKNGTVVLKEDGSFSYRPDARFMGNDTFTYQAWDSGSPSLSSNIATVTVRVLASSQIGLAKSVSEPKRELDGSYTFTYTFTVKNYGNVDLKDIQIKDNLADVFPDPMKVTVRGLTTTGPLDLNMNYNGITSINLLEAGNDLGSGESQSLELTLNVLLNGKAGTFENSATALDDFVSGRSKTTDVSTDGFNPDPNDDGNLSEDRKTPVTLEASKIFVPGGFSPNSDGINDKFIIENTGTDRINLEVYNRWGSIVYKNVDYKNDWDATPNQGVRIGTQVPDGTYYYIIVVNDKEKLVGYITINR